MRLRPHHLDSYHALGKSEKVDFSGPANSETTASKVCESTTTGIQFTRATSKQIHGFKDARPVLQVRANQASQFIIAIRQRSIASRKGVLRAADRNAHGRALAIFLTAALPTFENSPRQAVRTGLLHRQRKTAQGFRELMFNQGGMTHRQDYGEESTHRCLWHLRQVWADGESSGSSHRQGVRVPKKVDA